MGHQLCGQGNEGDGSLLWADHYFRLSQVLGPNDPPHLDEMVDDVLLQVSDIAEALGHPIDPFASLLVIDDDGLGQDITALADRLISMPYDLSKLPIQSLLRPSSDAGCGFYFPISIEALS